MQCEADRNLSASFEQFADEVKQVLELDKRIAMHPSLMPGEEALMVLISVGYREVRLAARLALLEPHECGKLSP
jgi:hypothetical protein